MQNNRTSIEFASIDHCECVAASDGFGQVTSASLRITSQLLPAVLILKPSHDDIRYSEYYVGMGEGDGVVYPRIYADYDLSQPSPYQVLSRTVVYCLRMTQELEKRIDMSLILRTVPNNSLGSFERIGMLQLDPLSPKTDGLEPETRDLALAALDKAEVRTVDII